MHVVAIPPLLRSMIDSLPEPHVLCDRDYRIVAANQAYRDLYSPVGEPVGRKCHEISHGSAVPCDQAGETCPLSSALRSHQRQRVMHLHVSPDGQQYVQVEITPLIDPEEGVVLFLERMEPVHVAQVGGPESRLVGKAPAFRRMLELVTRVSPTDTSVLLLGESGSGKEIVAHAVHELSQRARRPFVVVECASLTESLFESELFGHEKGAFTGAVASRKGLVESADGGTLFLDEVGDIPLSMQVKLLRLIETGCFRRVGSTELRCTNLRIIAATHRDIPAMVENGSFRQDLFFRIGTFPIRIPPLRERRADIEPLAKVLLTRIPKGRGLSLAPSALAALEKHDYPGNVRELRNILERASLLCDGNRISDAHVKAAIDQSQWMLGAEVSGTKRTAFNSGDSQPATSSLKAAENQHLLAALAQHKGDKKALASALGVSERTLYRKLRAARKSEDENNA